MPGEEEARVGLSSAQLATTALTTTTTTLSSGGSGTASSIQSSSTGVSSSSSSLTAAGGGGSTSSALKVSLPASALSNRGSSGLYSGAVTGFGGHSLSGVGTTPAPLTPILIASCPPSNSTVTTVNNNFGLGGAATTTTISANRAGPGLISNINSSGVGTLDGGVLNSNKQQQTQQPFQSNPLPGGASSTRPAPSSLLANLNSSSSLSSSSGSASGALLGSYSSSKQAQQQHPYHHQYQQQAPLSLKPIIATPNGNASSASVADTIKNGHGHHPCGGGGRALVDDDEIDEAGDSSKLELQLQFAGIDNETAVDVDVDDEENNYEAGVESGPMCTVVPTSKRNGNGGGGGSCSNGGGDMGGGHPSSAFPGGDVPSGGSGTMVAAAAGSVAPATSTTSSLGGGAAGAATGPTNSLAAAGTTTTSAAAAGGGNIGDEDEEDVEGGKTAECTEVVVPIQTFAEKCLFYTTAFFILLAVFSLFAFLFLVPFVIDPAFTTIFMEFDPEPAFCQTVSFEQKEGLSNCTWTSCREGCTREVYQCKQIRVNYRIARRPHTRTGKENSADFQPPQPQQLQQPRRPNTLTKTSLNINNVNKNFINSDYHGGSSSYQLASSDGRRSSEHSGSSFNIPFNTLITPSHLFNSYSNLVNNGFGGVGGTGGSVINTYHSASANGGGAGTAIANLREPSTSKLSKSSSSHYKNLMTALHHSSKYAVHSGSGGGAGSDLSTASLLSHSSSGSDVRPSGGVGGAQVMFLRSNKHSQQLRTASVTQFQKQQVPSNGDGVWDYTYAHLFPNVKGCGYPPVVVCSDFVEKYGKEGTNFSCYYSKVDRALVVTSYDMSRVIMDLVYSMAIPIPSFIISVVYLIFAYFRIYNTEASSSTHETGGGGRAERLGSSSTTTNLQNPGANRGGGGSSADDPDGETSLSVDDKTCIIQRSTSKGLNALSDKLPNSGKGIHAQVIEMNDLNPQLRHPVDGDVFLPQKRNNNCSNNPANPERNGPTNPAAKNKGEETTATSEETAVEVEAT